MKRIFESELQGLPDYVQDAILAEIENACRAAKNLTYFPQTSPHTDAVSVLARIGHALSFPASVRQVLNEHDGT